MHTAMTKHHDDYCPCSTVCTGTTCHTSAAVVRLSDAASALLAALDQLTY